MGTTGLESHFGPVQNPWHARVIPGGSSSGSAAAVATGLCYATVDTDAIGSCRLPSACCGVVGFKGTYGSIDLTGILADQPPPDETILWLVHAGIITRRVEDTACVLEVLATRTHETPSNLRVGIATNVRGEGDVSDAFETSVDAIRCLGHHVIQTAAPLHDLRTGVGSIERDRAVVAERVFKDIDLLLLPTTPEPTLSVEAARTNPLALSAETPRSRTTTACRRSVCPAVSTGVACRLAFRSSVAREMTRPSCAWRRSTSTRRIVIVSIRKP